MPTTLAEHLEKGETGVTAGKGLYDYTGKDLKDLLAKRDKQLFQAFRLGNELLDDPI
jgi:3-hydroxyacyl-CoA dehydrogenase